MKNSKKLVNLISLVVLVATNILSPLSYATAEDDLYTGDTASYGAEQGLGGESYDSDNASNEQSESQGGSEKIPSSQQVDETSVDKTSLEGQDAFQNVGEQPDGQIGNGENTVIEILKDIIDNLSGDIASGGVSTGDIEELTLGVDELTGTSHELDIARENLNSKPIIKSERYNKVTVNVEAPVGTFPEGTYAKIRPIISESRLDEIKEQISEEDDTVSEDSEIVAFDITFLYKLSDNTEVEVQPKDNTVKVTFDYEDNKNLSKADKDDEQEVKIFHLENKDENGEKVDRGDEKVVDVTNKQESVKDGTVVADAESFSVYAIVNGNENPLLEATLNGDDNTRNNFKYRTITISDGTTSYTIMDRNLGAKEPWDGVTWNGNNNVGLNSYGYHYHQSAGMKICYYGLTSVDYSSAIGTTTSCDGDADPCPTGWHLPSKSEWNGLVNTWRNLSDDKKSTSEDSESKNFAKDLKIPPTGYFDTKINKQGSIDRGSKGYYYTTTYDSRDSWRGYFKIDATNMYTYNDITLGAYARCFKDSANIIRTVTFEPNNGSETTTQQVVDGQVATVPSPAPEKDGYTLLGWQLTGSDTLFDFTGTAITGDITLYAKWQDNRCAENQEYNEELDICYESDSSNGVEVFYGVDMNSGHKYNNNPIGTITVKIDEGPYSGDSITIMDMNLGATTSGTTCSTLTETDCGDVYQRGNNIGLIDAPNTNVQEDYKNYRPGHRYGNTGFIIVGGIDYWKNVTINGENKQFFDALWGGLGDSSENNRGGIYNGSTRQGPCPSGYHVPSIGEWNAIVKYWYNKKTGEQQSYDTLNGLSVSGFKEAFLLPNPPSRTQSSTFRSDYYRSSSPYESTPYKSYRFRMPSITVDTNDYGNRINGYAIRCFKDSPKTPETLTLTFNANSGTLLGATSGTLNQLVASGHLAQQPVDPIKDNATFSKWTTDPEGISSAFDFSSHITLSNTLYAQYTCNSGYTEINGECVAQQFTVTFNANGGEITTGSVQVSSGTPLDLTQYTATKTDYEFIGWNTNSGATTKIGDSYEVNGNVTLYAIFKKTPSAWTIESGDFYPLTVSGGGISFTIMDRNLGAENIAEGLHKDDNGDNAESLDKIGYYYQWGNNYGFEPGANDHILTNKLATQVDITGKGYGPGNYYNSGTFILRSSSPYRWDIDENNTYGNLNLWGGSGDTQISRGPGTDADRQGPCPSGYHLPSVLEWQKAYDIWNNNNTTITYRGNMTNKTTTYSYASKNFARDLKLPFAGSRSLLSSNVYDQGNFGNYWSSSPYPSNANNSYFLYLLSSSINPQYYGDRALGLTVRCFKNSSTKTLTFEYNGGSTTYSQPTSTVAWWGTTTNLSTASNTTRANSTFSGWYTDLSDESTRVTTNAITDTSNNSTVTLYAKWNCNSGYEPNADNTACVSRPTVTFNANGGEIEGESSLTADNEGKVTLPGATREANENGERVFEGWFASAGMSEKIGNSGDVITLNADKTVYAHWTQTITIWDPANLLSGFTIMDRNLGAVMTGAGAEAGTGSYGYHYQWGNNYGFNPSLTKESNPNNFTGTKINVASNTTEYFGNEFVWGESNHTWMETNNKNLWGGNSANINDKQGPCPEGWHVPTGNEWSQLIEYYAGYYNSHYSPPITLQGYKNNQKLSDNTNFASGFANYFNLPFAGSRIYSTSRVSETTRKGDYWSSSAYTNGDFSRSLILSSSEVNMTNASLLVLGYSVRCFKNSYVAPANQQVTVSFDPNGGTITTGSVQVTGLTSLDLTQYTATKGNDWEFVGWNTSAIATEKIGDIYEVNGDVTLYAIFKKDTTQWLENTDFYPLDITGTDGKILFTIMDRNLGAIQAGTGENSYGYYYQWGNNYGFSSELGTYPANSGTDLVDITGEGYGPGKYYSSDKFIKRTTSPYRWDTDESNETYTHSGNLNLWGGENTSNPDSRRQGPCPSGYHVPDTLEWKAARETWCREKIGQANGQCNNGTNFRDALLLPFAGRRNSNDASIDNQGSNGIYWSSSPVPSSANNSYGLLFLSSYIYPQSNNNRANGNSVRCFKDSQNTQTLTFDADNGEDNVVYNIRWWEPITSSYYFTPTKVGYKFVGWYEGDAEFNFSDTTFITKDTIIKAKWEKTPRYLYDANKGYFNDGMDKIVTKSDWIDFSKSIENPNSSKELKHIVKFTGANSLHIIIGNWNRYCGNLTNIYSYDRNLDSRDEPYDTITQTCGAERNGCKTEREYTINSDVVTIETYGSGTCPSESFTGIVKAIGLNPYVIDNLEEIPSRTGYAFSGWYETGDNMPFNFTGTEVTQDRTLYAKWNPNHYTIQLDINEGTGEVSDINATYGEEITLPIVTREGYTFKGWQSEDGLLYSDVIPEGTPLTTQDGAIVILTAQWESDQEPSNNNYSGGGRKNSSSDSDSETHGSADEKDSVEKSEDSSLDENTSSKNESPKLQELDMKKYDNNYPEEQNQAYQFAYKNGITTQSTIKSARMNTELTRIQMAKMLSNYAINIMGQEPDLSKGMIKFNDVPSKLDLQYDNAVTKAYQLGIMGQNMKNNEFRPNDKVTRAEFATALSRLLYKTEEGKYKGTGKYYEPHIAKLYNEGIISKTDPSIKEKRGYVMTMLMRTVK